jgi:hypothetical protein
MAQDSQRPTQTLTTEDWQALRSFFELLIESDKDNQTEPLNKT